MLRKGEPGRLAPIALLALVVATLTGVAPAALLPAHAAAAPVPPAWSAGAAALTITPPAYNPADDARDYPLCDTTTVFTGKRLFDFEEPYVDRAGTGQFDYTQDPYCDANGNGRWDGLYTSGGVARLTTWVLSDIWARALAVSDGTTTIVIESITSQGLGKEDVQRIRTAVNGYRGVSTTAPAVVQVFVSSNHNESSPDPIGIYGAPADPTGTVGLHSGIDDYYISFLVARAAAAAKQAVDALTPARLRIGEFVPPDVRARLSTTFLTTDSNRTVTTGPTANGTPEATADKALVFQLVSASNGHNIETVFNWAAHNQQTGHAPGNATAPDPSDGNKLKPINQSFSDDWPGIFSSRVESVLGGHAMFLVGDNGSIEDPHVFPAPNPDVECPATDYTPPLTQGTAEGCATLPRTTGTRLADDVLAILGSVSATSSVTPHALSWATPTFGVPLQNQLFIAAFAAGIFAHHTPATASPCVDSNLVARTCFTTEVGMVDFGPDLAMLANPGEAYPALVEGHPFGREQVSCPERPEPPTPAWHSPAAHTMKMGLGNDMIGYEIPAPGWFSDPGVYADPNCPAGAQAQSNPSADYDQYNNYHKLESESVGPDGGNAVATHLAALADCAGAGTLATCSATPATCQTGARTIQSGRFLLSNGDFTRKGRDNPVGMWLLPCGTTTFTPGTGTLLALSGIGAFGTTPVAATAVFMDYDGVAQSAPDITTRGMLVRNSNGTVTRYFLDPYPPLTGASPGAPTPPAAVPEAPAVVLFALLGIVVATLIRRRRHQHR
jgi:hypothetical protein